MKILFTDLDGTLLDFKDYSFNISLPSVKKLQDRHIPIIFCTAKTRAENEYYRDKLHINGPFIVENGSAVFIPKNYFTSEFSYNKEDDKYFVVELGVSYKKIRNVLQDIRDNTGFDITGFGDMTVEELSNDCGLDIKLATLAKDRQYNESFRFSGDKEEREILFKKIRGKGFNIVPGGRYLNIYGAKADKGKAVEVLTDIYKEEYQDIFTYGMGDNYNDASLLNAVDKAVVIRNHEAKWLLDIPNAYKTDKIGPEGFNEAAEKFLLD